MLASEYSQNLAEIFAHIYFSQINDTKIKHFMLVQTATMRFITADMRRENI